MKLTIDCSLEMPSLPVVLSLASDCCVGALKQIKLSRGVLKCLFIFKFLTESIQMSRAWVITGLGYRQIINTSAENIQV